MVIEAKSIKGSLKGLHYQADDKGQAIEICRNGLLGDDPKDWHEQMKKSESKNVRVQNKRFSIVIAASKEVSRNLDMKTCENLVYSYFEKMGIDYNNYQFIAHKHNSTDDPHIHLILSRIPFLINLKNSAIFDNNIGVKSGKVADQLAKQNRWRTATEISTSKKQSIGIALREVLKYAKDYRELGIEMKNKGFVVQIAHNDAKGIYGMRIIPSIDVNKVPSERSLRAKSGYKLSEIQREETYKAKFSIADINRKLELNYFNSLSYYDKVQFAKEKKEYVFANINNTSSFQNNTEASKIDNIEKSKRIQPDLLDSLIKPNFASTPQDDLLKRKRKIMK